QPLPREDFGVFDEQSQEADERAVGRTPSGTQRSRPRIERREAGFRAVDVDALLARGRQAVRTEAGQPAAGARAAVVRDEDVAERALALAAPHQAVDVVRSQVVLDQAEPELTRVRIARADERRGGA